MNKTQPVVYRLYRGDSLLGMIVSNPAHADFPWIGGDFEPAEAFEGVRELFNKELELLNDEQYDRWDEVYNEIEQPGLRLEPTNEEGTVTGLLIHIDGEKAWWRY